FSGGGLAPPASPRRRPSLEGDILTQPRRHRSLVAECRRHFQVAHPRLMWSYDSAKHRELRVRSVVERALREGLGSEEADLRPDMTEFAGVESPCDFLTSIENFDPDLKDSSEGLSLTKAAALPDMSPLGFAARGDEEALGLTTISDVLSDGVDSEKMEANLSMLLLDDLVTDGAPEKRADDGEAHLESVEGLDVLSSSCFPVSAPPPLRFGVSKDRGYGGVEIDVGGDHGLSSASLSALGSTTLRCSLSEVDSEGASECKPNSSPLVSRSQCHPVLGEQGSVVEGGGAMQPAPVEMDAGGDSGGHEVVVGAGSFAILLPTDSISACLPCVNLVTVSAVDLTADGLVSEEVRVPPSAWGGGAVRPQPTDGLWQPPSSPMEPVSASVEKDKGIHGGVFGATEVRGGAQASRSYAHVVHADRRADVELSFIPPADGGNSITMEDSDGDTERWGSCLVGYFLQGSLPFGYVRSSVSRQWTKLGLTEVQSLDDGFFMFRFVDPFSRDGVLEGGP
ncbi:hypothetical protein Dimus_010700, partial [Dionaea muscipula]